MKVTARTAECEGKVSISGLWAVQDLVAPTCHSRTGGGKLAHT